MFCLSPWNVSEGVLKLRRRTHSLSLYLIFAFSHIYCRMSDRTERKKWGIWGSVVVDDIIIYLCLFLFYFSYKNTNERKRDNSLNFVKLDNFPTFLQKRVIYKTTLIQLSFLIIFLSLQCNANNLYSAVVSAFTTYN